ncbi:VTT domain-containing protein [Nocardiopsis sp. NPDC007018]|uniref:DedA family protein n=1 Tax=Nocardiopsis sp. NPDC007018 TaxID=3155721 RepID=UPI0033DCD785
MPQFAFLEGQPFWVIYCTLLVVILLRAPATYWIGRGLGAGVARSRLGRRLGPKLDAAKRRIDRYGAPVVTLSFFTVGMQTAINLSAGAVRMRFPRYFAAVFVGGLAWAGLWGVVIAGLVGTWMELFLKSPWTAVGVVVAAAVAVAALVARARLARRGRPEPGSGDAGPGPVGEGADSGAADARRV